MPGDEAQGVLNRVFDSTTGALKIATGAGASGASGIAAFGAGIGQAASTKSGIYMALGGNATTSAIATNSCRVAPVYFPTACTLSRIGAEVTSTGGAGSVVRLGIWNDTGSFYPGTVLLDAGTIDGTSVTIQEITISQALNAGVYWFGASAQVGTLPTMRAVAAPTFISGSSTNAVVGTQNLAYVDTQAGALATFTTTPSNGGTCVRVFWKVA